MRLIDADRFLSQIEDQYREHDITRSQYVDFEDRIMQQPTIEIEPHWIPCSERLPEMPKGGKWFFWRGHDVPADEYIVMIEGATEPTMLYWTGEEWSDFYKPFYDCEALTYSVIAWMPLPEPYKEG